MIALYLLAAHMVGDFVLQTRWQAAGKFTDRGLRFRHCVGYTVPFIVLALIVGNGPLAWYAFPVAVFALHYLTDSRRFLSTIGDWVGWRQERVREVAVLDPTAYQRGDRVTILGASGRVVGQRKKLDGLGPYLEIARDLPPNPWPPIAILIDQTLHVCQLALLAGLFLT